MLTLLTREAHTQDMTQTKQVHRPAEIHVREGSPGMFQLSLWDDEQRPEGSIVINRNQSEMLMRDLAAALGFTLVSADKRAELGRQFTKAVEEADAAKNAVTGHYDYDTGYQNAAQSAADTVRDLRAALRYADVVTY